MTDWDGPSEDVIAQIIHEMKKNSVNRARLAERTNLSMSTINNFFLKKATFRTQSIILGALKLPSTDASYTFSPDTHGHYTLSDVSGYIGKYILIRPAFDDPKCICAFPVELYWNTEDLCLKLRGSTEWEYDVEGDIYLPRHNYISISYREQGYATLITLSSVTENGNLYGLMLCLGWTGGNNWVPMTVPAVLRQVSSFGSDDNGRLDATNQLYEQYNELLSRVVGHGYGVMQNV